MATDTIMEMLVRIPGILSLGGILSFAWRLYRYNFYKVLSCSKLPSFMLALLYLFVIFYDEDFWGSCPIISPAGPVMLIAVLLIALIYYTRLSRLFYAAIINEDTNPKAVSGFVSQNFAGLLRLLALIILELILFVIVDFLLLALLIFLLQLFISSLESLTRGSSFGDLIWMIIGYGMFFFFQFVSCLITIQCSICVIQLLYYVSEKLPVRYIIVKSVETIYVYLKRFLILCCLGFNLCFFLFINTFTLINMVLFSLTDFIAESLHLKQSYIIYNITDTIVLILVFFLMLMVLLPYSISVLALFLYDVKTRHEGTDLLALITSQKGQ